ncbi:MAG: zinc ribbon domain-containing protein [Roseiarcus sp.]|jgi:uncharacterized OB-fold protein
MIDFSAYDVKTPEILAYRCLTCGAISYPAPMICSKCSSRRDPVTGRGWETFPLEGPATLLSWTRVWNLPDGYNVKFLLFGMAEFDNGLRASGRIGVAEPSVGMRLSSRVEESDERPGKPVNVLVFE